MCLLFELWSDKLKVSGLILLIGMLFSLGGCSAAAVAVVDNVLTTANGGETCSVSKIFRGKAPCKEPEVKVTVVEEPLHCYRTLGVIDCYRAKDPFAKIEGRSPGDKLQVSSPSGTAITGDNDLLNSKRMRADTRPTIVRRSTPLMLEDPVLRKPVAKKQQAKPAQSPAKQQNAITPPPMQAQPQQPMGPVRGVQPPLKS